MGEVKRDYCFVALPVVDSLKHIQSDVVQSEVKMMSVGDLDGERNDTEKSERWQMNQPMGKEIHCIESILIVICCRY